MICRNCGYESADGAMVCERCGHRLDEQPVAENKPVRKPINLRREYVFNNFENVVISIFGTFSLAGGAIILLAVAIMLVSGVPLRKTLLEPGYISGEYTDAVISHSEGELRDKLYNDLSGFKELTENDRYDLIDCAADKYFELFDSYIGLSTSGDVSLLIGDKENAAEDRRVYVIDAAVEKLRTDLGVSLAACLPPESVLSPECKEAVINTTADDLREHLETHLFSTVITVDIGHIIASYGDLTSYESEELKAKVLSDVSRDFRSQVEEKLGEDVRTVKINRLTNDYIEKMKITADFYSTSDNYSDSIVTYCDSMFFKAVPVFLYLILISLYSAALGAIGFFILCNNRYGLLAAEILFVLTGLACIGSAVFVMIYAGAGQGIVVTLIVLGVISLAEAALMQICGNAMSGKIQQKRLAAMGS